MIRIFVSSMLLVHAILGMGQEVLPSREAKVFEVCRDPSDLLSNLQIPWQGDSDYNIKEPGKRSFLSKRNRNIKFFETMRFLAPPSTVAFPYTSYTRHLDGSQEKKPYILDASVRTPIALGGPGMGLFTIHVIPAFDVRIFNNDDGYYYPVKPDGDESLPVRTPSNRVGAAFYWSHAKLMKTETYERIPYFRFFAYHHSNGQDDSTYVPDPRNGDRMVVNTYNGNFSDDVAFEVGFGIWDSRPSKMQPKIRLVSKDTRRELKDSIQQLKSNPKDSLLLQQARAQQKQQKASDRLIRKISNPQDGNTTRIATTQSFQSHAYLGLSIHPLTEEVNWQIPTLPENAHMYPKLKLHTKIDLMNVPFLVEYLANNNKWCLLEGGRPSETIRLSLDLKYTLDANYFRGPSWEALEEVKALDFRRLNVDLSIYRILNNSNNTAVFASTGLYGSDPYNIYFNEALWYFKFGLAFGFFNSREASAVSTKNEIYYKN